MSHRAGLGAGSVLGERSVDRQQDDQRPKTSGQKLPFIVDTPLARLDSKHRDKLVELFFPHASHQMMIFSTNTEVDRNEYFLAHINRGVELLVNRVRGLENLA